ncbi:hypothetical protein BGZ61DRAFT_437806 [Ilyonectria robusta]|uniref:uncharacterized protein n=1 Tax=Ilyonectria robusta TaxID=1079257 RepID=UPI001E8EBE77|nr:uncharacterized protein BGZ61DRAFT_437806 [Ilyonectria robusta]KAH8737180.1 hypothetical protein BGZ61DRAFT_437806 [Ilyonectria robusta]
MISMRLLVVQFILLLGRRLAYAGTGSSSQRDGRTAGRISGHGSYVDALTASWFPGRDDVTREPVPRARGRESGSVAGRVRECQGVDRYANPRFCALCSTRAPDYVHSKTSTSSECRP